MACYLVALSISTPLARNMNFLGIIGGFGALQMENSGCGEFLVDATAPY
jgi:hypothetical protein